MLRYWPWLVLGLCLSGCTQKSRPEPYMIGHIVPLSGPEKVIGEHARQGIMLAIEELNKQDSSTQARKWEVVHVDPQGRDERLQPITVRLITLNKVLALMGGTDINQADQIGRAARTYDVPLLTTASLSALSANDNVFSLCPSLETQGDVLARFLTEVLKADKVAVLIDDKLTSLEPFSSIVLHALRRSKGIRVEEIAYQSSRELNDALERVRKSKPAAIAHFCSPNDLTKVAEVGVPILYVAPPNSTEPIPELKIPVYQITPWLAENGDAKFVKAYQDKFGEVPDQSAALAYESIRLLVEVHTRAQGLTSAKLKSDLSSNGPAFNSLTGPITFDKTRNAQRPVFVVRYANGKLELAKRYDSEKK